MKKTLLEKEEASHLAVAVVLLVAAEVVVEAAGASVKIK